MTTVDSYISSIYLLLDQYLYSIHYRLSYNTCTIFSEYIDSEGATDAPTIDRKLHESTYLKASDHSSSFWVLVDEYNPEYQSHASWLEEYSSQLVFRTEEL
ncbi:DUF45 domain-containing protein [Salinarchaeum sp. IM2453]|uniref:YgjP-like metallopeptidase domain-containing protein n=1 Tax=Salinarchaeum sp. IM2453 TaxID=2862870 RepID=UPI001C83DE12|nr:DUF45 domain-containing protein [Salinarchaeum sp. IM2453]